MKRSYLISFLTLLLFSSCQNFHKSYESTSQPQVYIEKIDQNFDLLLNDGKKISLAHLKFPSSNDRTYQFSKSKLELYVGKAVQYRKSQFGEGYFVQVLIPKKGIDWDDNPFTSMTGVDLNATLVAKGAADFISPVKDPQEYRELLTLTEAQKTRSGKRE